MKRRVGGWQAAAVIMPTLLLAAILCVPNPSDPDAPFHEATRLGAFFFTGFWIVGVIHWGRVLCRVIERDNGRLLEWLAYGSAGASMSGFALAAVGLSGWGLRPLFVCLALLGPVLDLALKARGTPVALTKTRLANWLAGAGKNVGQRGLSALFLAGIGCAILSRAWGAGIAHLHSDVMVYHAYGPRLWAEAGRMVFPWLQPVALQASYWECLAVWGNGLLGGPAGGGLVEVLLFMQWTHVLLGFAASAVALDAVLSVLIEPAEWRRLAVFAGLTSGVLGWTAWLGKNDWGLVFWCLAGLAFAIRAEADSARRLRLCAASGVFFGMAFADKYVLALPLLPLGVAWARRIGRHRWARRSLLAVVGGFVGAAAPILLRNAWDTGNPVFPSLNQLFGSPWLSETKNWVMTASQSADRFGFSRLSVARLGILLRDDPFFLASVALATVWGKRLGFLRFVPLCALALLLALLGSPPGANDGTEHMRYLSYVAVLGPGLGLFVLQGMLESAARRARGARWMPLALRTSVPLALFGLALCCFKYPLVRETLDPVDALRRSVPGGMAMAWLRMYARPGSLTVSTGDDMLYPVSQLAVVSMRELPYLDRLSLGERDPASLVRELESAGATYVLDALTPDGKFWTPGALTMRRAVLPHPDAVLYNGSTDSIVDLHRLYGDIFQSCSLDSWSSASVEP